MKGVKMMKSLVKFEFLKILRKKSTLVVMAVSLLITAVFFVMPILQFQIYNQDEVLRGLEGIAYEKEQYAEISVPLTNEYVTEQIREVQDLFADPDNIGYDGNEEFLIEDAYWNGIAPREDLLTLIAKNYAEPNVSVGYNALPDLDISNGTDFYQARQDKIEKILNDTSKDLSAEEKAYWQNMNSQVNEPFQYGYFGGWEVIISAFELLMFAVLAICIVIAPCFLRRISVWNGCGYSLREIRKNQINYRKNCGGAFIWCAGVYASCPCCICNSSCCLWD